MKVYAVWNLKGGTGKTTSTVNIAYNCSQEMRVLIIDNDPQSNATPFFRKVNEQGYTIRNLYKNPDQVKRCIYRTKYKHIDIIRGSTYLTEKCAEQEDYLLQKALKEVEKDYDIVLIDCRPSFEALTRNALIAADTLITPILLDGYCRDNLNFVERAYEEINALLEGKELQWMVFANRVENHKNQKIIYKDLIEKHLFPITNTCISNRVAVASAAAIRKPLLRHRRKDTVTQDYLELSQELGVV